MVETDLIWMSLVVFIPSVFALGLLFFPKGWEEAMRWWSLFGTALTLGASICLFALYKHAVTDATAPQGSAVTEARFKQSLLGRVREKPTGAQGVSDDWVSRYDWIKRFNIEYYLGVDGISMPLILMTTALCFLAMIASWK